MIMHGLFISALYAYFLLSIHELELIRGVRIRFDSSVVHLVSKFRRSSIRWAQMDAARSSGRGLNSMVDRFQGFKKAQSGGSTSV